MDIDPALLSRLVHDLRSPLTKVLSFSRLLELDMDEMPPAAAQDLEHLVASAREAYGLITVLGDWARADRVELKDGVALEDCARKVLDSLATRIEEAQARVEVDPLPTIRGDVRALGRLITELVDNVLRHAGEAPSLHLYSTEEATLVVEDRGDGIPPQDRERFLEPLVRKGRRHGLGLAIAARIAAAHGGRLWLSEAAGGGVRACVNLPR